jgi:hypothetical protein
MKRIKIDNNQSIWDLAIQYYGSVDGIKQLILDNPTKLNLETNIIPGTEIIIREEMVINKAMVDYLNKKGITCATAVKVASATGSGDFSNDFNNDYN